MEIRYTRSLNRNYVNFLTGADPDTSSYEIRMLLSGQTEGILPCSLVKIDGTSCLSYDITGYRSLSALAERGPFAADLTRRILGSVLGSLRSLSDCLLDRSRVPLHPDCIYVKEEPFSVRLCFLPPGTDNPWCGLGGVMEFFLRRIDPSSPSSLFDCYRLYRAVTDGDPTPEQLLALLIEPVSEENRESASDQRRANPPFTESGSSYIDSYAGLPENDPDRIPVRSSSQQRDFSPHPEPDDALWQGRKMTRRTVRRIFLGFSVLITAASAVSCCLLPPPKELAFLVCAVFGILTVLLLLPEFFRRKPDKNDPPDSSAASRGRSGGKDRHFRSFAPDGAAGYSPDTLREYLQAGPADYLSNSFAESPPGSSSGYHQGSSADYKPGNPTGYPSDSFADHKPGSPTGYPSESFVDYNPGSACGFSPGSRTAPPRNGTTLLSASPAAGALLVPAHDPAGRTIRIPETACVIGKDPDLCPLTIPEETVSRIHAKLHVMEDGIYLEDLNSTNGTFVNEEAVLGKEKKKLRDGDRVRFAASEYIFHEKQGGFQK